MTAGAPRTIVDAAAALRRGEVTAAKLLETRLARADEVDDSVGVFVSRFDEQARAAAEALDAELADGRDRGPLHGIPIGVKDLLTTVEGPTTAQSVATDRKWRDQVDAPVVARLRAAGGVIVGKTTLSEFACGFPDPSKPFPIPRNPWDTARWAGGSSGGSASGVATGAVLGAVGTDTGGSVRIPAGFCGVTGLKTTIGLVPTAGCVPLAPTFDSVGPIALTAEDCRVLFDVMRGESRLPSSEPAGVDVTRVRAGDLSGVRIGVDPLTASSAGIDPGQPESFEAAISAFAEAGATIVEAPLPQFAAVVAANYAIMLSEALAYHLPALRTRWDDYGESTRTLLAGAAGYTGADFAQALRVRWAVAPDLDELFGRVDVHMSPMATITAPRLDEMAGEHLGRLFGSIHTPYWSTVGYPALSVPVAPAQNGLPLGVQIAAPPYAEDVALAVGAAFQTHTQWHLREAPCTC